MRIAIISDTHDNIPNLEKALAWIKSQGISLIIHCGDIFKTETIREALKIFKGEIHVIFSKADADFSEISPDSFENLPRVKTYEEFGELQKNGKKIAFCHFPEIAKELTQKQEYDLIFYGHTHKPWEETVGKTKLVNPGNLAGMFYKATFAIYDTETDKLELNLVEQL